MLEKIEKTSSELAFKERELTSVNYKLDQIEN